eukprot:IDg4585t1
MDVVESYVSLKLQIVDSDFKEILRTLHCAPCTPQKSTLQECFSPSANSQRATYGSPALSSSTLIIGV